MPADTSLKIYLPAPINCAYISASKTACQLFLLIWILWHSQWVKERTTWLFIFFFNGDFVCLVWFCGGFGFVVWLVGSFFVCVFSLFVCFLIPAEEPARLFPCYVCNAWISKMLCKHLKTEISYINNTGVPLLILTLLVLGGIHVLYAGL